MNPAYQTQQNAAFQVTAGSYAPIFSWIFMPGFMLFGGCIPLGATFWKHFVTIEGREHPLKFGEPVIIPVTAGHHVLEFCVQGLIGGKTGRYKYTITVAPGYVQPLRYRMGHLFAGLIHPFRIFMVVKKTDPELGFTNQGYPSQQPMQTYGTQPSQLQQPMPHFGQQPQTPQHLPHFAMQPPQTVPQYASQPEFAQPRYDSPFTDGEQNQSSAAQVAAKKFCTQCGTAVVPGNRFCGGCGQSIS